MSKNSTGPQDKGYHQHSKTYRSTISPRSSSMSRSKVMPPTSTLMSSVHFPNMQSSQNVLPYSILPTKSLSGSSIREFREKEKKELSELNDRFANYVERVRFLEAQNKQLRLETDALKSRLGANGSKIKDMYETELKQARDVIEQTTKEKLLLETKTQKAEDDADFLKERYDDLLNTHQHDLDKLSSMAKEMSENEASIKLMTRRMSDMEEELKRYKNESQKLLMEVQRITADLYQETSARLQLQNEKQSLEEELSFLKQIHAQEIEDLQQLAFKDTYLDPSNFFRHELANAIKDIRAEYETLNQQQKAELENWYRIKVTNAIQELQTKKLFDADQKPRDDAVKVLHEQITTFRRENTFAKQKNEELENRIQELEAIVRNERESGRQAIDDRENIINDLRSKLDDLLTEYEELLSNNTNLNSEISIYRKLLEGGEEREGLRHVVEEIEQRARKDWAERHQPSTDRKQTVTFQAEIPGDEEKREESGEADREKVEDRTETESSRFTVPIPLKATESPPKETVSERNVGLESLTDSKDEVEHSEKKTIERPMSVCGQLLVDISYDVESRSLAFVVKRARNVQQFTGSLFVRCTLMPNKLKQKSHAVTATSVPVWNTLFEFDCPSINAAHLKTVYFALKHSTSTYRGNQVVTVGRTKLPLSAIDLESGEFDHWIDLHQTLSDQQCSDSSDGSNNPY